MDELVRSSLVGSTPCRRGLPHLMYKQMERRAAEKGDEI
jgi:hypothetical protein